MSHFEIPLSLVSIAFSERLIVEARLHPNNNLGHAEAGFVRSADVNDRDVTILVSFFSTCQIDASAKGRKILTRGKWIYPGIAFEESESILKASDLIGLVTMQQSVFVTDDPRQPPRALKLPIPEAQLA